MSRNFRAEEEDLDLWYDEEKEKLSTGYYKGIDETHDEDEEAIHLTLEEKTSKQDKYLHDLQTLRYNYHTRYHSISHAEFFTTSVGKIVGLFLSPFISLAGFVSGTLDEHLALFKNYHHYVLQPRLLSISAWISMRKFLMREFYLFHVKNRLSPLTHPLSLAMHTMLHPFVLIWHSMTDAAGKYYDAKKRQTLGYFDISLKFAKKVYDAYMKRYKVVAERVGKVMEAINKVKKVTLDPIFTKFSALFSHKEE